MSEPTLIMKLTALRDYVMVLGVSESDCDVFDEAVEAIVSARSAALEEAALPTRRQDMTDLELVELALRRVADREERRWATHGTVHTAKVELLREIAAELAAIRDSRSQPKPDPTP